MSTRYPGGFINRSAPVIVGPVDGEGGSAPGVWTLEQASYYTKQGMWPQRVKDTALYLVGSGTYGALGNNSATNKSSPVQISSTPQWKTVDGANYTTLAIKQDGSLWGWGYGPTTGVNLAINISSPVQVGALTNWLKVSSKASTAAIKTDGSLWTWGDNRGGQLGQGTQFTGFSSSPVQVGAMTNWSSASWSRTNYGAAAAIKTDGTLWTWGSNLIGELGQNNKTYRSSPVQVGALTTWLTVSGGSYFFAALQTDKSLWTWGINNDGQLGVGDVASRSSPTQVGALTTWSKISAGGAFVLAIKTDGTLWTWGDNPNGQLGQSNLTKRSSPVQIGSLSSWFSVGTTWFSSYGVLSDGTAWAWGLNSQGELAQNNTINRSSPVQIGSATSWALASGGVTHVALLQKT